MTKLSAVIAQLNPVVGDIPGNTKKIIAAVQEARFKHDAQIVIFPELILCGYPPEDLLLRPSIQPRVERALEQVAEQSKSITVILGYPWRENGVLYNMAGVIQDGVVIAQYAKNCLPNYQVFDEKRYFAEGSGVCVLDICGVKTSITICEDIWDKAPMAKARAAGALMMLNINASPFHKNKQIVRQDTVAARAQEGQMPVIYINQVGGQDELVFDGGSMAVDGQGKLCFRAPLFEEGLFNVELEFDGNCVSVARQELAQITSSLPSVYDALVMGVRDYVNKNNFKRVVLGLSGGIDSALTLAIAVDALSADRVEAVMMPFRYTSKLSLDDAEEEARRLGVKYKVIGIEPIYDAFCEALAEEFAASEQDKTEENIQARSRGVLLMAISNKSGCLVLTTGNKSEMAVGYATLYGDMAGGLDVLKDVPKTMVFELAKYRNKVSSVIPESVISRPPSAELAPDQVDEDSLPPYEVLDQILEYYIEQDMAAQDIVSRGFDEQEVNKIVRMVDINEYKRRQAPIGIRISEKGFGRDRRYPVTNGWRPGD
jgi:NAD+ synthase (glutamine-hydrolysing)